jgi:hypothetical protein
VDTGVIKHAEIKRYSALPRDAAGLFARGVRRYSELSLLFVTYINGQVSCHKRFKSKQDNEYFLHHRRSGRGRFGRRLSRTACLKTVMFENRLGGALFANRRCCPVEA